MKIGITGSLSSGKTCASKFLSKNKYPIFSADKQVSNLYKNKSFRNRLKKTFKLDGTKNIKKKIKTLVLEKKLSLKRLEKIIHPIVRKRMKLFALQNRKKKFIFFEIPLLIESRLESFFNIILFIDSKKNIRLKRYLKRKGNKKAFLVLDNHQLNNRFKKNFCDHVIVNNNTISVLNKKLMNIMKLYDRNIS